MFHIVQKVMVRNMHLGPAWIPGVIIQKLGPVLYLDIHWKCHVDQFKEVSGSMETPMTKVPPQ